jgi:shikimate kinase
LIEEVEEILAQRESLYRSTAHWAIETSDRSPGEVADEVVATWSDYVAASAGRLTEIRELGA